METLKLPEFMKFAIEMTYYSEDDFKSLDKDGIEEFKCELEKTVSEIFSTIWSII